MQNQVHSHRLYIAVHFPLLVPVMKVMCWLTSDLNCFDFLQHPVPQINDLASCLIIRVLIYALHCDSIYYLLMSHCKKLLWELCALCFWCTVHLNQTRVANRTFKNSHLKVKKQTPEKEKPRAQTWGKDGRIDFMVREAEASMNEESFRNILCLQLCYLKHNDCFYIYASHKT